jgi:hypothetical protein
VAWRRTSSSGWLPPASFSCAFTLRSSFWRAALRPCSGGAAPSAECPHIKREQSEAGHHQAAQLPASQAAQLPPGQGAQPCGMVCNLFMLHPGCKTAHQDVDGDGHRDVLPLGERLDHLQRR